MIYSIDLNLLRKMITEEIADTTILIDIAMEVGASSPASPLMNILKAIAPASETKNEVCKTIL